MDDVTLLDLTKLSLYSGRNNGIQYAQSLPPSDILIIVLHTDCIVTSSFYIGVLTTITPNTIVELTQLEGRSVFEYRRALRRINIGFY